MIKESEYRGTGPHFVLSIPSCLHTVSTSAKIEKTALLRCICCTIYNNGSAVLCLMALLLGIN